MRNLEETFGYDGQNRLTGVWLGSAQTGSSVYDGYGRMTAKTADGQPVFSCAVYDATAKPHAMDKAVAPSGVFPSATQAVDYTGFDKVSRIRQGADSLRYTYGCDHQRVAMTEYTGGTVRSKRYVGSCEYVSETSGNATSSFWLTCLTGPTGVYAVVETRNGTNTVHYVLKDNLGSWTTVTDADGVVEQLLSYDAWGSLRDPLTWSGGFTGKPMFDRGFTGHEHLAAFGLINMNGRMYDPVMSSFLSVDRFVQCPESAQGFNRYAYCMHNPLRYVDPSGWFSGPPKSRTALIQDYLSDPCYITRQQLKEAGMYDIEGGYGWSGGHGSMSAGWMEGDGMVHTTEWSVTTSGGGFDAGAWAIPSSFYSMWVNDCHGFCSYGFCNYDHSGFNISTNSGSTNRGGGGNWGGKTKNLTETNTIDSSQPLLHLVKSSVFIYDGQVWPNSSKVYNFDAGQHVKVELFNENYLGVQLSLQDISTYHYSTNFFGTKQIVYSGNNYTFVLLPKTRTTFDFYRFDYSPINWMFEMETNLSDVVNVRINFYSEWKPGMAIDPNHPKYKKPYK